MRGIPVSKNRTNKKIWLSLIHFTIVLFFALQSFATTAPRELYHWTSARGLNRWATEMNSTGEFRFKALDTNSSFLGAYPQFAGAEGLFAWTDPVTAMGSFSAEADEWYARENSATGEAARLVVIRIKENMPVIELTTTVDRQQFYITSVDPKAQSLSMASGSKPGLILHKMVDAKTGEVFLQEYVLLKRGHVELITADPSVTRELLQRGIQRLQDPTPFTKQEMHFITDAQTHGMNSSTLRKRLVDRLYRTLKVPTNQIPQVFQNVLQAPSCSTSLF